MADTTITVSIDPAAFARKLAAAGINPPTLAGKISYSGCTFDYTYAWNSETLQVRLVSKPPLVPEGMVMREAKKWLES